MARPERVYKVALFGVTGCGKSSIINLLSDKPVANVSTGVEVCTRRARWYPISLGEKKFRLWDTMGFNQAEAKGIDTLSPYEQAHTLLRNLQDGVDLVLLCARKDGINASLRSLYWLLDSFFFGGRVQIAFVLTHFDTPDDQWWERNRNTIAQKCNIPVQSLPYVCRITTVQNESPQSDSLYDQSKQALKALLQEHASTTTTSLRLDLSSDISSAAESLNVHCQLSISDATSLVAKFRLPKRPFHAILFGESGVGKSSIINLLDGHPVAEVSHRLTSCTLDYRSYKINTGSHQFLVWDTVGFNGVHPELDVCEKAIQNAVHLIRDLRKQGGVDLLVFCRKDGRISRSELDILSLFQEFLCQGQIPVAFIVTHLERRNSTDMEKWWDANGKDLLGTCKLKAGAVAGHACITSLALDDESDDHWQELHEKLSLSRHSVQTMLEDSISYGSTFTKDEGIRAMSFLKKLVEILNPPRKLTVKNLTDRCGLTKEQAEELIKLLYT